MSRFYHTAAVFSSGGLLVGRVAARLPFQQACPQGGNNQNVTIVLPITEDCDAQGAIYTGEGRKLSNSLDFTVSGPS